jgi:cytoskeletal protein CcmA (bactofilin family)
MQDLKKSPPSMDNFRSGSKPSGNITFLTHEAEFKGALAFSGDLEINGRLEGTIEADGGKLTVGETAIIKADLKGQDIIILGKLQGNIIAEGRVELRGKAQVYGDIKCSNLHVEDGVVFVGRSETAASKADAQSPDFSQIFTRLHKTPSKNQLSKPDSL